MNRDDDKRIRTLGWLKLLQEKDIYQSSARFKEQNDRLLQLKERQIAIQEELVGLIFCYESQISKEDPIDPNYLTSIEMFIHQIKAIERQNDLAMHEQEIAVRTSVRAIARDFIRKNVLSVSLEEERDFLRQDLYTKEENSLSDIRSKEKASYQVDDNGN